MFNRSIPVRNWHRGSSNPGAKHQKHVSLCPTPFLYMFSKNSRKPGPYVMKYFWTLGCFPTGMSTPFRVAEFRSQYRDAHVPDEVDDWLKNFVADPVDVLTSAVESLFHAVERLPDIDRGLGFSQQISITGLLPHVAAIEKNLGVHIPAVCAKGVTQSRRLRTRLLDELHGYQGCVREGGSTPHRRLLQASVNDDEFSATAPGEVFASIVSTAANDVESREGTSFSTLLNIPPSSAPDELQLVRLLTTFSEGAMRLSKYDDAKKTLESALQHCHDDDTLSMTHSNIATASNRGGFYSDAEAHAKEAVLLNRSKTGFMNLSVALAYQDRCDEALSVVTDAVSLFPDDADIQGVQGEVMRYSTSKPKGATVPSLRIHSPAAFSRNITACDGNHFQNEFDTVAFNGKQIHAKLNPQSYGLGTVFRRATVKGLAYRSSTMGSGPL